MSSIQPTSLTNNELLRYALVVHDEGLSEAWAKVILQRFAALMHELSEERIEHGNTMADKLEAEFQLSLLNT